MEESVNAVVHAAFRQLLVSPSLLQLLLKQLINLSAVDAIKHAFYTRFRKRVIHDNRTRFCGYCENGALMSFGALAFAKISRDARLIHSIAIFLQNKNRVVLLTTYAGKNTSRSSTNPAFLKYRFTFRCKL